MYMFSWQISWEILRNALENVKQDEWKMGRLAEKVCVDLMAGGKDIETARCRQVALCAVVSCA